jgi:hypothetical protein
MYKRYDLKNMSVGDLYNILTDDRFDIFFCCIERSGVLYRYRIPKISDLSDLQKMFERNSLRRFESGLNSDEINVFDSDFIDCYIKKYPNK